MRNTIFLTTAVVMTALLTPAVQAQSNQLEEQQMAVVCFDFRLDKIRESDMSDTLDLESKIKGMVPANDGMDPKEVNRVFGAMSAPESMEAAQGYAGEGPLPIEVFVRVEFATADAADKMIAKAEEKGEADEIGGKVYYRPTEAAAPDNFIAHRVDETTVEMGTEAYLLRSDRKVFTEGLTASWEKTPSEAIRIAMDLAGAETLVSQLQELAAKNGPPNLAAYYELIGNISDVRLTADMDGDNLLTLGVTGKSGSETEDLEGGLKSLVGLGQIAGMGMVGQLKQQLPELGGAVEKMLTELKAERVAGSDDIEIKIIHPEGFAEALKGMMGN